ncbi:MAG: SGNH/GDSL hydrolase family protein [Deltaproteobacteria bacterium]|nr:SGNH/GDSL hydrolase family protein [Deltaproteobacteria bacterium]
MRLWVTRLLLLLAGLLVAIVLAEGGARLAAEPPLAAVVRAGVSGQGMAEAVADARVFAGRAGYDRGGVTLDERGLRTWTTRLPHVQGESAAAAPQCHLVVLGDSVAFGHGVSAEESFPARLERDLGWRVTNLSFPGWNTAQEAAALARLGSELKPDLIVLTWVSNDVASLEWDREAEGEPAMYVSREVELVPGMDRGRQLVLWKESALWRLLSGAVGTESVLLEEEEHREALARIGALAGDAGARVVFAQVPPFVDRPGWEEAWGRGRPAQPHHREVAWRAGATAAREEGFSLVDLTEAVAGSRPSTLGLDPVHPNAAGHAAIAGVLGRALLEVAPRCVAP